MRALRAAASQGVAAPFRTQPIMNALVLVAGYLGAGKTRTLTALVPRLAARRWQPIVVLSDARNARIDATRFAESAATVYPLASACLCCDGQEDLLEALASLPLTANSIVLVESSGTTDTESMLGVLTVNRQLTRFSPPMQLTVVDVARWQQRYWHDAIEQSQLRTASHVMFNWTERAGAERVAAVSAEVVTLASRAQVVDLDSLTDAIIALATHSQSAPPRRRGLVVRHTASHAHDAALHHVASFEVPLPAIVGRAALEALVRDLPDAVLRMKGIAVFDEDPSCAWVWHRIDRSGELFAESIGESDLAPVALCIGGGSISAEICARFAALAYSPLPRPTLT